MENGERCYCEKNNKIMLRAEDTKSVPPTLERCCRRACEIEGVDPNIITVGLGYSVEEGLKCKLWQVRIPVVSAILMEL